jgi:ribosome modulation factor
MLAPNIYETGRRAYRAGLKPKDCPFAIRSAARSWWLKGYNKAKKEAAEESKES